MATDLMWPDTIAISHDGERHAGLEGDIMIFPMGTAQRTSAEKVETETYDVIIVGAGISGAIIANELGRCGKRVLILEAGPGGDRTLNGYQEYLERFFTTAYKD